MFSLKKKKNQKMFSKKVFPMCILLDTRKSARVYYIELLVYFFTRLSRG